MTEITVIVNPMYGYTLWFEDGKYIGHDDQVGVFDLIPLGEVRFTEHEVDDPEKVVDACGLNLEEALESIRDD